MPAVSDAGQAASSGTLLLEDAVGPCVEVAFGRRAGKDAHGAADDRAVEFAEREDAASEPAHGCCSRRGDRPGDQRGRGERAVIDRRDETCAHELRLIVRHRVTAPQTKQHRRERLAPDGVVQGDAAHEDAFVGRGRDGRRPRCRPMCLARTRSLVSAAAALGSHCATW